MNSLGQEFESLAGLLVYIITEIIMSLFAAGVTGKTREYSIIDASYDCVE